MHSFSVATAVSLPQYLSSTNVWNVVLAAVSRAELHEECCPECGQSCPLREWWPWNILFWQEHCMTVRATGTLFQLFIMLKLERARCNCTRTCKGSLKDAHCCLLLSMATL